MNDKPTEQTISDLPVITKFIYSIGVLPTSYKMSMTYEEQVVWLCNYLETTVIPAVNQNGEAVEELQNLYELLRTYVNDYFDNLDVQDEINQKLEVMADDGSLTALIKNYVDPYIDIQNNQILHLTNDFNDLENRVNGVASGSPAGVYATLEDLNNATTDKTRIYVVTATGNWYYWSDNQWNVGGSYQTTQLTEGSVKDFQTSFYENVSLYPYDNWIQGKVLNVNNGDVTNWETGCYNPTYVEIDPSETYIIMYNDVMPYEQPTVYTYDENKEFLGYERPIITLSKRALTFDDDVKYVRFSFWSSNFSTLSVKSKFITLSNALKLESYMNINSIKDEYFNTINSSNILLNNDYGFRLLPYQEVAAGNPPISLKYKSIYEVESENSAINGNNFIGFTFDYDTLSAGDKIIIDATGSTNMGSISLFATASSTSDTLSFTKNGNIYTGVLTQGIITAMNNAKGVNDYYPRLMMIRNGQVAGTVLKTNMKVYINNDFTSFTNYVDNALDIISEATEKQTLSVIALGDSITALQGTRSWLTYFNEIQPIQIIQNTAVNGAWLMDKEGTIYDGNPVFNGPDNNVNNVLGNQVQKIINNNYEAPDIIMIAIGTNGGITCTEEDIYNSYYDSQGNLIPLQDVDRKTSAGAFRYCNETLRNQYPNATIFWCSPIQAYYGLKKPNTVINWGNNLKNLCEFSSVQFVDTQDCGITAYTEYNGANGLYLIDGLHPNTNGAKYMGYYNASKVKEYTEACKLFNE